MTALMRTPSKASVGDLAGCASHSFDDGNRNRHELIDGRTPRAIIWTSAMIGPLDRCLIVEENFLIRQDLADILQTLGVRNIDEAESIPQAMELIAATRYRIVFINIIHADKNSQAVAEELKRQKIPIVVTTACLATSDFPPSMIDVPVISKPYSLEVIRPILAGL
jgi:CheY-like chemotaxis protein